MTEMLSAGGIATSPAPAQASKNFRTMHSGLPMSKAGLALNSLMHQCTLTVITVIRH